MKKKKQDKWVWSQACNHWALKLDDGIVLCVSQLPSGKWRYVLAGGVEGLTSRSKWIEGVRATPGAAQRAGLSAVERWIEGMEKQIARGRATAQIFGRLSR